MHNAIALAAVDLGSNSFRLEVSTYEHQQIQRLEYLKETIRQGNGLDAQRNLSATAMEQGWACLARFGERLRGLEPHQVRAVATQTLREARNREVFIERGSQLLGFPIEVISGEQEAELIYRGVVSQLPAMAERRLVMDIGGRSTELVLGCGRQAQTMASYRIGSVSWTARYFPQGALHPAAFDSAEIAARAVLDETLDRFPQGSWDQAYASAGTANAVSDVLEANGFPAGVITRQGLDWLHGQLLRAQHIDKLRLDGLKEDRRPVIAGGLSIMRAAFDLLGLDGMQSAQGALRLGVLHSLVDDALPAGDVRTASVEALMQRFAVQPQQARQVAETAGWLWQQIQPDPVPEALRWAALLHEVGCRISASNYHRHSAYIVENCQAKGFSPEALSSLSQLVLGQRGKLKKVEAWLAHTDRAAELLCLRLAVLLCNSRTAPELQGLQLSRKGRRLQLRCTADWQQRYPHSAQLLRDEAEALSKTDWRLELLGAGD